MSRKVARAVATMPKAQQERLALLVDDIRQNGPVRANWPNYSILAGTNTHHCQYGHGPGITHQGTQELPLECSCPRP